MWLKSKVGRVGGGLMWFKSKVGRVSGGSNVVRI